MIVKIAHPETGLQSTQLLADVLATATTSSVENSVGFAQNDILLYGSFGNEKTEIVTLATLPTNQSITHSALKFDHPARTPINMLRYNQVEISRSTSEDGAYSVLTTIAITPDEDYTVYDDSSVTETNWYKVRYKNSVANTYSSYSDPIEGVGYTEESLYDMTDEVLEDFGDPLSRQVSRKQVKKALMAGVRKLVIKMAQVMPQFRRQFTTQALTATQLQTMPARCLVIYDMNIGSSLEDSYRATYENEQKGYKDSLESETSPKFFFRGDQFGVRPQPTGGNAYIWYLDAPIPMTDDSDEHGLPYGAREPLVAYALYRLWLGKNQDKAGKYKTEFKDSSDEYIEFVAQSRQTGTPKRVGISFGSDLYE